MAKLKGIDISEWQENVNFLRVKADGIKFVILREGYKQTIDGKFFEYVQGFKNAEIPILGVYHFSYALNVEQAKQEAVFCVNNIKKAGLGKDVIVFFDFEYDTVNKAKNQGVYLDKAQCIAHTKAFCEQVTALGYKAGIYSNIDYYNNMYDKDLIAKYVFWLAHYTSGNPAYPCSIQQYGSEGKVNGIAGNVDMNWYFGDIKNISQNIDSTKIANEVIQGLWGNGEDRKAALENAGYNYNEIQNKINEMLGMSSGKSIDELAQEVINGKWGNGQDRMNRLKAAGYDYNAVQNRVNQLL